MDNHARFVRTDLAWPEALSRFSRTQLAASQECRPLRSAGLSGVPASQECRPLRVFLHSVRQPTHSCKFRNGGRVPDENPTLSSFFDICPETASMYTDR